MGKIPNFTDSERFETPKTDCMLKFLQRQRILSAWIPGLLTLNTEERATLIKDVTSGDEGKLRMTTHGNIGEFNRAKEDWVSYCERMQ